MQRRYRERVSAESATVPAAAGHAAVSGVTPPATAPTATAPTATAPTVTAPTAASSPPLLMRIRPAHWATVDYVVATLCAVIIYRVLFGGIYVYRLPVTVWHARDWIPPLLAVCLSVPVAIRRGRPLLALILVLAACVAAMGLGGLLTRAAFLPLAIVLYLVAATRPRRVALAGLAGSLLLMALQAMALHMSGDGSGNAVAASLVLIMCWMAGLAVQQRRAYTARLREQVAGAAVTEERLRIARELHDVVAHSMTVVAVQAGFGEYVFDRQPAEARAALAAVEDPEERLRTLVTLHLSYFIRHPNETKVLTHEESALGDKWRHEVHTIKKSYYRLGWDVVSQLRQARKLKGMNTRVAVLSLFGMMNWIYTWYNPRVDPDAATMGSEMADLFLHGICGRRPGSQQSPTRRAPRRLGSARSAPILACAGKVNGSARRDVA